MSEFLPWFLQEFLPPLLPWVLGAVLLVSALFWISLGVVAKKILKRRRESL